MFENDINVCSALVYIYVVDVVISEADVSEIVNYSVYSILLR